MMPAIRNIRRSETIFLLVTTTVLLFLHQSMAQQQLFPCTEKNAHKIIEEKDFDLLICSFGPPPKKEKGDWWNANGISFYKVSKAKKKAKPEFILQIDEFDNAVDYRYKDKSLSIIKYSETLPGFKLKPFIKQDISLADKELKRTYEVLLKPKKYSKEDISDAISFLNVSEDKYMSQYQDKHGNYPLVEALFKLRDYAVQDPEFVAKKLSSLSSKWWCDGEMAETLAQIKSDVQLLRKLKLKSN